MVALIYPIATYLAISAGGYWSWLLLPLNIALIPAIDHAVKFFAPDWEPSKDLMSWLFATPVLYVYVIAQALVLIIGLQMVSTADMNALQLMGVASALGIMTGTGGITLAHELMHRSNHKLRVLAQALLAMVGYMHFTIVHLRSHHRYVGTSRDDSTAPLGEGFPKYFSRALVSGVQSAWKIESARLSGSGRALASVSNGAVISSFTLAATCTLIALQWGWAALVVFILQAFIAVHLLEAVNYVQHYGLTQRDGRGNGRPLEVDSWDSDFRPSELVIFNLSRHSEHHVNSSTPCAAMGVSQASPKLPYSFFLMVFFALFPPIWHAVMDHRVRRLTGEACQRAEAVESNDPVGVST